jgi:hypothetical protein
VNHIKLLKKRELWVPTLLGWILILSAISLTAVLYVGFIHSFLAVSKPVRGQILVVEGWIPPFALEHAASEFKGHGYGLLVLTGGTHRWTVSVLKDAGVNEDRIAVVSDKQVRKDRTYSSAIALKEWLLASNIAGNKIDVFTLGVHGRRSLLLHEMVLGDGYLIGVISSDDLSYDPNQWWLSTEGIRSVVDETLAYIYTRLFLIVAQTPNTIRSALVPSKP